MSPPKSKSPPSDARVIVTRPAPDDASFAAKARARGFSPIISPILRIGPFSGAAPPPAGVALAFTSANGVRAYARLTTDRSGDAFAVGAATAEAARAVGFPAVHVAGGDLSSLTDIIAEKRPGKLAHVAGRERAGDLVALVREEGVDASLYVLYQADPVKTPSAEACAAIADLEAGGPDLWVTLFSPRSARLFLEQLTAAGYGRPPKGLRAACLSRAVADALGAHWRPKAVAARRDADAILDAIADDAA
ncbi:MAG: uroporphyrinogen-III synthase [Pseudomonadota bacterium]